MLDGKTILITGSSRGIGAAIARLAKKYGAQVILHGRSESEELIKLSKELESSYVIFDVANEKAADEEIARLQNIDILVNNAGINPSKVFLDLTSKDWQEILNTNLFGVVNVSRAVLRGMLERKSGRIINISSIKGFPYVSGKPAYAASKAAVIRITSSMAEEFAPYGILINSIAPGFVDTELTKSTLSPKIKAQIDNIPLKRLAQPEEIAEAVLFLASDRAGYITGQTLAVDGGLSVV